MKRNADSIEEKDLGPAPKKAKTEDTLFNRKNNWHWLKPVAKREDGSFLKLHYSFSSVEDPLPVHVADSEYLGMQAQFFCNKSLEPNLWIQTGIPGIGKSTMVMSLAEQNNCAYVRLDASATIFKSMMATMDKVCSEAPIDHMNLHNELSIIAKLTLTTILEHLCKLMVNNKTEFLTNGDFNLELTGYAELADKQQRGEVHYNINSHLMEVRNRVREIVTREFLIIHIDNTECWAWPDKGTYTHEGTVQTVEEAKAYRVHAFVLACICWSGDVRTVLTGRNPSIERLIYKPFLKRFNAKELPTSTLESVRYILDLFVDTNVIDTTIMKQLIGPFRILQYFIYYLYNARDPQQALESAYNRWKIIPEESLKQFPERADALMFIHKCPEMFFGAKTHDVVRMSTAKVPEWAELVEKSLLTPHWMSSSNVLYIQRLYPFLLRLLIENCRLVDYTFSRNSLMKILCGVDLQEKD